MSAELPHPYVEVRDRLRIHTKQIRRRIPRKHPEYTVALLIAIASEVLSRLQGRKRHWVFAKWLLGKYGVSHAVGRGLFKALRDGLAHRYDTSVIDVAGQKVVVVVTWRKPQHHLRVKRDNWLHDGTMRLGVFLDTETMWNDLERYWKKVNEALQRDAQLAKTVRRQAKRMEQKYRVTVAEPGDVTQWQRFLAADRRLR